MSNMVCPECGSDDWERSEGDLVYCDECDESFPISQLVKQEDYEEDTYY